MMESAAINLAEKLGSFTDLWSPKIIAEMDGFQFRLAKLHGDFVWHRHPDTDEAFLVLDGVLRIDLRDETDTRAVTLRSGELYVVPKGIEHKPFAENECHVMVLVREGTVNTGDAAPNALTRDPTTRL